MKKPKVSIIIPVYNVEKYLHRCLDSVKSQSYSNIEVLLIDDGSKDKSGVICDEYVASDSRFHVYHKDNEGVSKARNTGLDHANGDWITFIDSDDFISNTYLENLIKPILNNTEVDFVHGCGTYFANGQAGSIIEKFEDEISSDTVQLFNRFKGFVCCKLFKRELIEHPISEKPLRFDYRIRYSEDMVFTLEYVLNVKTYAFSREVGYFYNRDNNSSATHSIKMSYEESLYAFEVKYRLEMQFVKDRGIKESEIRNRIKLIATALLNILFKLNKLPIPPHEKVSKLKEDIGVEKLHILKLLSLPLVTLITRICLEKRKFRIGMDLLKVADWEMKVWWKTKSLLNRMK